jgi:hypothetical protein
VHGLACLIVDGPLGAQWMHPGDRLRQVAAAGRVFADLVLGPQSPGITAVMSSRTQSPSSKGE